MMGLLNILQIVEHIDSLLKIDFFREVYNARIMEIPNEFMCPISMQIMYDPVLCAGDGFAYERKCIEKWLEG